MDTQIGHIRTTINAINNGALSVYMIQCPNIFFLTAKYNILLDVLHYPITYNNNLDKDISPKKCYYSQPTWLNYFIQFSKYIPEYFKKLLCTVSSIDMEYIDLCSMVLSSFVGKFSFYSKVIKLQNFTVKQKILWKLSIKHFITSSAWISITHLAIPINK